MALIGSITNWGEIQGQINDANGVLTGVISSAELVGGQVVGMRGLKGDKGDTGDTGATGADGQDGADGFSPSASVSKVDNVATITITDKDGTTTAEVYDGSGGGASAFIAEYGVTTYADVKDAYDEDAIILCTVDDSGNTAILQLAYFDDANDTFYFAQPKSDGFYLASITIGDTWDDGSFQFATTDTATQLRDGLMSALDYQKLDGIASGAEVNVQSDWNEADSTADDYIKNKPTIPPKNVWYGTCSTSSSVQQKSVTTLSGDFALDEGNILLVEFASTNSYDGATLSVDELTAKAIYVNGSPTNDHRWRAGEVVIFVYDGYHFNLIEQGTATTSYYGITKLSSSTSSTSELIAATPKAVKAAYDEATDATATPTASKKSKFDSDAHMNSTDMTTGSGSELEDFIDGLNVSGGSAFLDMFYPVGSYYETSNASFDPNVTWGGTWVLETEGQVHVSAGANYDVGDTGGEATHTLTVNEMPHHMHDIALYGSGYSPQSVTRDCITTNAWSNRWSLVGDYMDGVGRNDAHNNMQPYIVVNRWHRTA